MEDYKLLLSQAIDTSISALEALKQKGVKSTNTFSINCHEFEDYTQKPIHKEGSKYKVWFDELQTITGPVLYWFEITNDCSQEHLFTTFDIYKKQTGSRATPAKNKHPHYNTSILYVGKVKRGFWGRVIQHLGFYSVSSTQGLQLYHWAATEKLQLKLHVIEFEPNMEDLMPVLEITFARVLKPLLGKHK